MSGYMLLATDIFGVLSTKICVIKLILEFIDMLLIGQSTGDMLLYDCEMSMFILMLTNMKLYHGC